MPKLDIVDLEKSVRGGHPGPVYVILGQEGHMAKEAVSLIRGACEEAGANASSTSLFSAKESKVSQAVSMLKNVSMFGTRPLVIIREAESLQKEALEILADYCEKPIASSTLVIVAEKLDGRTRFMQVVSKTAAIVECKPLYMEKIPSWINAQVRKGGRQISQDAAQFLANLVGNNLSQLSSAIEKIVLYIGDKKLIELKDVEGAVAETHQHTIFELTDAVGLKNLPKALSLLQNILDNGESPVLLLNMLARHFRILSKAKEVYGRPGGGSEVASYLGVHPYFVKNYLGQSRNFSKGELKRSFGVLHKCDRELKSSRISKERVIEKALFALAGK